MGEVDELHMYGGVIRASFGFGRIRKLVMHHKVDTGDQSGGGFGITFPLSPSAVSSRVLDNIRSVSVSISTGGMVRLNGGKCIFDVPGVEILNWQEFNIPDREYDTRTKITATVNNTTLWDSAPTGTTPVGSIGMDVGDVPVHTDIPSGIIPGHEGRQKAWHKHTKGELEAKASRGSLDREEQEKLQHSKDYLKAAAEKRKAELLEKRKARTLTREEAEELQPILDREAAERAARQQAEVDRRKAEAKQLVEEGVAEAAEPAAAASAGGGEGETHPHSDPAEGDYESIEIDEKTMEAITDFDRVVSQMTDAEKEQFDRVLSVYDPNKSDAQNEQILKTKLEELKLEKKDGLQKPDVWSREDVTATMEQWSDECPGAFDDDILERRRISNIEHEAKYPKMVAQFLAEWYAGGVIFRVLKLGFLGLRGHQLYEAGKTLPYVLRGSNAGRIAKPLMDTLRIPSEVTGLARQLQQATKSLGGKLFYNKLTKDQLGYVIHLKKGGRSLQIRVMDKGGSQPQPYWRVTIDGKGAFTSAGQLTHNKDISHIPINSESYKNILEIIRQQMGVK